MPDAGSFPSLIQYINGWQTILLWQIPQINGHHAKIPVIAGGGDGIKFVNRFVWRAHTPIPFARLVFLNAGCTGETGSSVSVITVRISRSNRRNRRAVRAA